MTFRLASSFLEPSSQFSGFPFSEGNIKIKLSDGKVVIGQFRSGVNTGLRREWDEFGNLIGIGYRYRDAPSGRCW